MNAVESEQALIAQAHYLSDELFGARAPDALATAYARAHAHALGVFEGAECGVVDSLVRLGLDLVAVEYAMRIREPTNLLTKKVRIFVYLAESHPDYFAFFINDRDSSVYRSIGALILEMFRSGWKALKGLWLIWRYRLV